MARDLSQLFNDMTDEIHEAAFGWTPLDPDLLVGQDGSVEQMRVAVKAYREKSLEQNMVQGPCCSCVTAFGRKCRNVECPKAIRRIACDAECGECCENKLWHNVEKIAKLHVAGLEEEIVLQCDDYIIAGTIIGEFKGVLSSGYPNPQNKHAFPIQLENCPQMYLNATDFGNEFRYLLHDKDAPNCKIETWIVGENIRLFVIALRDIPVKTTMTVCYPQMMIGHVPSDGSSPESSL